MNKNKSYDNRTIGSFLFISLFVIWNVYSCVIIWLRHYLFNKGMFPYDIDYDSLNIALRNESLFILFFIISFVIFGKGKKETTDSKVSSYSISTVHSVNLFLLFITLVANLYTFKTTGSVLLTGDYMARWEVKLSATWLYIPQITVAAFFYNIEKRLGEYNKKKIAVYIALFFSIMILNALSGSRSLLFTIILFLLYIFFKHFKTKFNFKFAIKFVVIFSFIYLLGQLYNVVRWYALKFDYLDLILQINADSFPELRSYVAAIDNMGTSYGNLHFGFLNFCNDFISRILPSFFYDIFGLNRMHYYNSSWTNFLDPIIYGKIISTFGIRIGLVGEIDLLLGFVYIILFAIAYGYLFNIFRCNIVIAVFLIRSIVYGVTANYLLILSLFAIFLLSLSMYAFVLRRPTSYPKGISESQ